MTNYDYLIIGGGMTAGAGVDGIREVDPIGGIGMIGIPSGRRSKFTPEDICRPEATYNEEGVVYYLKNARVRGVLLWNVWGQVQAARELIAESGPFTPKDLEGLLPVRSKA